MEIIIPKIVKMSLKIKMLRYFTTSSTISSTIKIKYVKI